MDPQTESEMWVTHLPLLSARTGQIVFNEEAAYAVFDGRTRRSFGCRD